MHRRNLTAGLVLAVNKGYRETDVTKRSINICAACRRRAALGGN